VGGFLASIFGGQSKNLNGLIDQYGQIGQSQTGQGQKNENQAGSFWSSILSGDSSKVSQALSPEISAAKKSAQEQTKTNAEFGGRSGGTAASTAATNDKVHSDITNLIGSLTNSSASSLASLGSNQVGTGLGALGQQEQADARRMENWSNSILGLGLTKGAGFLEGMGLSGIAGLAGKSGGNNNNDDNS
jgi:hypothetical protein